MIKRGKLHKFHSVSNATFSWYGDIDGKLCVVFHTSPKDKKDTLDIYEVEQGDIDTVKRIINDK
jgi:hypothetical protein